MLFITSILEYTNSNEGTMQTKLIIECFLWFAVAFAIILDLFSGIRKAKERGELRVSEGYRRTVDKVKQYYGMLLYAFLFDCLLMYVLGVFHFEDMKAVPFMSLICAGYLIFIECRSFMEKANAKSRRMMKDDIDTLLTILKNREDMVESVRTAIKESREKTDATDN